jgi:hypothetical protein
MMNLRSDEIALLTYPCRRRLAWRLRHEDGWTMQRIAALFRVSRVAICHMLQREKRAAARLPAVTRPVRQPARLIYPMSLSSVWAEM